MERRCRLVSYRLLGSMVVRSHDACGHPPGNGGAGEQQVRGGVSQTTSCSAADTNEAPDQPDHRK